MKKLIILTFIVLPTLVMGQITWGVKGGANVTTLGEFSSIYAPQLRLHAGLYYQQRLEQQYGILAELQFSMQGARAKNISRRFLGYNYALMPILMKFYFVNDLYVEVGPQFGYLINARFHDDGYVETVTDQVKRFDFSALIGAGRETDFGNFGARFGFGLTNTSGATVASDTVFRNLLLQIYVAYTVKELK